MHPALYIDASRVGRENYIHSHALRPQASYLAFFTHLCSLFRWLQNGHSLDLLAPAISLLLLWTFDGMDFGNLLTMHLQSCVAWFNEEVRFFSIGEDQVRKGHHRYLNVGS